jgi:Gpi18-like mannosyltransferase
MRSRLLPPLKPIPVRDMLWLFLGTRLLLVIGTYLSFILFPVPPHVYPQSPVDMVGLLSSWKHWDAVAYIQIAQYGYQSVSDTAFFPLFPILVKCVALLLGNHAYTLAAMLVSNLALLGALYVLYQIATDALGEQVGRRTLLYLCLFPTAFFFFTGYNESLFLLLTCSTLFALRHQKWILAGGLGALAALTRSAGVLLAFPFLYELWMARDLSQPRLPRQVVGLIPKALPIVLIPLGILCYCYYCWRYFGNPLSFAAVEKNWGRPFTLPWTGIIDAFKQIFFIQPFGSFMEVHTIIDLSAVMGFIALAIVGWRYLSMRYTIWIVILLLFMLSGSAIASADPLFADQRYVLEMFPAFIILAALSMKHQRLHQAVFISFPFLQAIMAALFVLHRWMV